MICVLRNKASQISLRLFYSTDQPRKGCVTGTRLWDTPQIQLISFYITSFDTTLLPPVLFYYEIVVAFFTVYREPMSHI